jgi:hypothetical protein
MNSSRVKLNRRTKKRRYSKKSRRFNTKRKTTRKHLKTQKKKYRRNMKGGEVFKGTDQGCSFWPSIFPENEVNQQTVTKVFYNRFGGQTDALQKEETGYAMFDTYDPEYLFHARKISSGPCSTQILQGTECENDRGYEILVPGEYATTTYINTEYVGISLRYEQIKSKSFKIQLINFFIGLLRLRYAENCLVFSDLNGGNICYMCNGLAEECIFKCIDVGGVFELAANQQPVELARIPDIENQFINIRSLILNGLRNFTMRAFEYVPDITYEANLAIEIQKLQAALDYVTATEETVLFKKQLEKTTTNVLLSRPGKKAKSFFKHSNNDEEDPPPSRGMFGFSLGDETPPPSRGMFDDEDYEEPGV